MNKKSENEFENLSFVKLFKIKIIEGNLKIEYFGDLNVQTLFFIKKFKQSYKNFIEKSHFEKCLKYSLIKLRSLNKDQDINHIQKQLAEPNSPTQSNIQTIPVNNNLTISLSELSKLEIPQLIEKINEPSWKLDKINYFNTPKETEIYKIFLQKLLIFNSFSLNDEVWKINNKKSKLKFGTKSDDKFIIKLCEVSQETNIDKIYKNLLDLNQSHRWNPLIGKYPQTF